MTTINETIRYDELPNGIFTPSEDVIIKSTLTIPSSVEYKFINLDMERTKSAGSPCYRNLYFISEFFGPITIGYSTHGSVIRENDDMEYENEATSLSYPKVTNKTTVLDDGYRESIDFRNIADVEPLITRYMFIQQFVNRRLVSRFVLARAMDDYFSHYWDSSLINISGGYVQPEIPWLMLNKPGNNSLDYTDSLSITIGGEISQLDPYDESADRRYDAVNQGYLNLTPKTLVDELVDTINSAYDDPGVTTEVLKGDTFTVQDNGISFLIDGTWEVFEWRTIYNDATSLCKDSIIAIGANVPTISENLSTELNSLVGTVLTDGDTGLSLEVDIVNGSVLTIGDDTINFLGEVDSDELSDKLSMATDYDVPDEYSDDVTLASRIKAVKDVYASATTINGSGSSMDEMLSFLES